MTDVTPGELSPGLGPWEQVTWWQGETDCERAASVSVTAVTTFHGASAEDVAKALRRVENGGTERLAHSWGGANAISVESCKPEPRVGRLATVAV